MGMRNWIDLCTAAGINVRVLEPVRLYQLAGRIIHDGYLTKLAFDNSCDRLFAMKELMTQDQLEALRGRVLA